MLSAFSSLCVLWSVLALTYRSCLVVCARHSGVVVAVRVKGGQNCCGRCGFEPLRHGPDLEVVELWLDSSPVRFLSFFLFLFSFSSQFSLGRE